MVSIKGTGVQKNISNVLVSSVVKEIFVTTIHLGTLGSEEIFQADLNTNIGTFRRNNTVEKV